MADTHTAHTDTLIRVLHAAEDTPGATQLRARSYELLNLTPGATVVDVGCGTGRAVAELAEQGAHAIGVDHDAAMLAAARGRFPDIDVRAADAADLPLSDGQVHGYRADKVYHVLPDPHAALAEARRVLAPGGRIVLLGQDWDTLVIDSDQPELTRRIVRARADTIPHPRIARAYRTLLRDVGFSDVQVEVHTRGVHRRHPAADPHRTRHRRPPNRRHQRRTGPALGQRADPACPGQPGIGGHPNVPGRGNPLTTSEGPGEVVASDPATRRGRSRSTSIRRCSSTPRVRKVFEVRQETSRWNVENPHAAPSPE
jgi:SAM-dependent methyltransferase